MGDLSHAYHQLYLLTGERDPAVHWQVFCDYDHAKKELARSYHGTLSELAPTLANGRAVPDRTYCWSTGPCTSHRHPQS